MGLVNFVGNVRRMWTAQHVKSESHARFGEVASGMKVSGGIPEIDYVAELEFPDNIEKYKRMANDPQIAKELRSQTLPLEAVEWDVEPASDGERDVLIAEFCASNLFQKEGEAFGRRFWSRPFWLDRLRDILRMLQNGFAVFQKVRRTEGRFIVFDTFKYILPESIERFRFDERDNLVEIIRNYTRADEKPISNEPIAAEDLTIYTWDREGSNILGKPLIRPMFKSFEHKTLFEQLEVVDRQKRVGFPSFEYREGATKAEIDALEKIVQSMRGGSLERLYGGWKVGNKVMWTEPGQGIQLGPQIERRDTDIAKAGGMGFMDLGIGSDGGSRGVAGTQAEFGGILLTAVARITAAFEQEHVRELVDMNFSGVSKYPKAKASNIDPLEKTRHIAEINSSIGSGLITVDLQLENDIRKKFGLMEIDEETRAKIRSQVVVPGSAGNGNGGGGALPGEEQRGKPEGASGPVVPVAARRRALATVGEMADIVRVPSPSDANLLDEDGTTRTLAQAVGADPEMIHQKLTTLETFYLDTLSSVRRDMIERITEQVRRGKNLKDPQKLNIPFQGELRERLTSILKGVRDFGRERQDSEIRTQIFSRGGTIQLVANPLSVSGAVAFANQQAEVGARLNVGNLVRQLSNLAVEQFNLLIAQGLPANQLADEIEALLKSLSQRSIEDMARTATSDQFNLGRNIEVQKNKKNLQEFAVRTEIIDENTCPPCRKLDGRRVRIDSPEYMKFKPPSFCDGRRRCRAFYLVFAK